MPESRPVHVQRRLHPAGTAQQVSEEPVQVGQAARRARPLAAALLAVTALITAANAIRPT